LHRKEPLKEILASTRALWDHEGMRCSVRENFNKVLMCRTEALGSEVYASSSEQTVVHHTCKSRSCPSCGYRATRLWQRKTWSSLPDVKFAGVVFTMPDVLWPIFRINRDLSEDLSALGAAVIRQWAKDAAGVCPMILVVRHTFGRHLNFNPHLHILVSDGGLTTQTDEWRSGLRFDNRALMKRWRFALITYLREALRKGLLRSQTDPQTMRQILTSQYERWWSVDVQPCASKEHFIRYAGRYVRRPPLAQYRMLEHSSEEVKFRTQDHKLKKEVVTSYTSSMFINLLSQHVPDHYKHAVRHFGLLSPRSRGRTFGALFAQLRQARRAPLPHLSRAKSIEREFGVNPQMDTKGEIMRRVGRLPPNGTGDMFCKSRT
jgi:hypothetical protein